MNYVDKIALTILLAMGLGTARANDSNQRALLAYLKVKTGTEQQFLGAARDVIAKTRQEAGNITYTLHRSVADPQQFVFYELFRTEKDLQDHKSSTHVTDFLNRVNPILVQGGFVLQEYTPQ